jgi:hypothetical protein
MDKQIESLIGNYRITANIGQGALSEVYNVATVRLDGSYVEGV